MTVCRDRKVSVRGGKVSLILPLAAAGALPGQKVTEYREILQNKGDFESVEVIVASAAEPAPTSGVSKDWRLEDGLGRFATHVVADGPEWSSRVRAGLRASTGGHLVVLDPDRHYSA